MTTSPARRSALILTPCTFGGFCSHPGCDRPMMSTYTACTAHGSHAEGADCADVVLDAEGQPKLYRARFDAETEGLYAATHRLAVR
jgi:hypothetical protein